MYRDDNRRRTDPAGYNGARVYVGDIGNRIGKQDLQKEFEQYGQVLDIWMTPQHDDGRFYDKKFAFVVFRYPEDADIAVRDKNGRHVCGRKVRVEHAKPPKSQMGRNQDYQRGMGYGRGRGRGGFSRGGYYNQGPRHFQSRQSRRSRSFSPRERSYGRSSPYQSPPRSKRLSPNGHHPQDRYRASSFSDHSPDRHVKRPASFSPEITPRKSSRQDYVSVSPSPPPRQPQRADSRSFDSRSLSPAPKKMKRKRKKRSRSKSRSRSRSRSRLSHVEPELNHKQQPQYYSSEEGEYGKPAKSHKSKKSKSKKKKKREIESGEEYSSDENY